MRVHLHKANTKATRPGQTDTCSQAITRQTRTVQYQYKKKKNLGLFLNIFNGMNLRINLTELHSNVCRGSVGAWGCKWTCQRLCMEWQGTANRIAPLLKAFEISIPWIIKGATGAAIDQIGLKISLPAPSQKYQCGNQSSCSVHFRVVTENLG